MTNKIKALGVAFFAVVAMGAIAGSAQASEVHTAKAPVVFTGTTNGVNHDTTFQVPLTGGGNLQVKSTIQLLEATTSTTTSQDVTATGTYTGSKVNGLAANVRMNGCKYTVTGAGHTAGTATIDITGCTVTKQIEVEQVATGCIVKVPEQNGLSHVVFTQQGTDATLDATVTGITAQQGALCPNPNHHSATSTFQGNTTIQAFEDSPPVQVTRHGHQYSELKHNSVAVAITVT